MSVILVNGSAHAKGCTFTGLSEVAKALNANGIKTEIFQLGNKPIAGCCGCRQCNGFCVKYKDDKVNEFLTRVYEKKFDGFVFGTPVHYAAANGALTSFMDRAFFASDKSIFRGKPAACVVSCRRAGSTATFDQINKYFTITHMPIVSSQYWNEIHGGDASEVKDDIEGLQIMRTLGKNMAWLIKCIKAGKDIGIEFPTPEPVTHTNFVRKLH